MHNQWLYIFLLAIWHQALMAQSFQEVVEILSPNPHPPNVTDADFGYDVDMHGDCAIVGAPLDSHDENQQNRLVAAGAAYIYKRDSSGVWQEHQKIVAPNRDSLILFGRSVAIHDDFAVVGMPDYKDSSDNSLYGRGTVFVYKLDSSTNYWGLAQQLFSSDLDTSDLFGYDVNIFNDWIMVGAINESHNAFGGDFVPYSGSVYVFQNNNGLWVETQKLVASDRNPSSHFFGASVSVWDHYAVVGAFSETNGYAIPFIPNFLGGAYVFKLDSFNTWQETQKLTGVDSFPSDGFGNSVDIYKDQIIVGAPMDRHGISTPFTYDIGSAYTFTRNEYGYWGKTQRLIASDRESNDNFGWSVSITDRYLSVGAYRSDDDFCLTNGSGYFNTGSTYVFQQDSFTGFWDQYQKLIPTSPNHFNRFGNSVCIENKTLIVGSPDHFYVVAGTGSTYFYEWSDSAFAQSPSSTNIGITICAGDSVTLPGGQVVHDQGIYVDSFQSSFGCDSLIITHLFVDSFYEVQYISICQGDSFQLPLGHFVSTSGSYSDTLTSSLGCDSIVETILTMLPSYSYPVYDTVCHGKSHALPGGSIVSSTGIYIDSLLSSSGCDSVITTHLTVLPEYLDTVPVSICQGDSFLLPNEQFVNSAGVYLDTLTSSHGCDSVVRTILEVSPSYFFIRLFSSCVLNEYYVLPDGDSVAIPGSHIDTFTTASGCDSIIYNSVWGISEVVITQVPRICEGEYYVLPGGDSVNTAGTHQDTVGCSRFIVHLSVLPDTSYTIDTAICHGETYLLPSGMSASAAGTYIDTLPNLCETITTNLSIHPPLSSTRSDAICQNNLYILPDGSSMVAQADTTLESVVVGSTGCDSVISIDLTVFPTFSTHLFDTICAGDVHLLPDGSIADTTGTYVTTFSTENSCDSTFVTHLIVYPTFQDTLSVSICQGNSYLLPGGSVVSSAGNYVDTLTTRYSCDSIIFTNISVLSPTFWVTDTSICDDQSYILPDEESTTSAGTYIDTVFTTSGCDSIIVTTHLSVHPSFHDTTSVFLCEGDSFLLADGSFVSTSGMYTTAFSSSQECDSILVVDVLVYPINNVFIDTSICHGDSVLLLDGSYASSSGLYTFPQVDQNGCTYLHRTNLATRPIHSVEDPEVHLCAGDSYTLPDGTIVHVSGTYSSALTTSSGCDSIVATEVIVHDVFNMPPIGVSTCENEPYALPDGTTTTISGTYSFTETSSFGCDSVITIVLDVLPTTSSSTDTAICLGSSLQLPDGATASSSGMYTSVLTGQLGCDSTITTHLTVSEDYHVSPDQIHVSMGKEVPFSIQPWHDDTWFSIVGSDGFSCDSCMVFSILPDEDIASSEYVFAISDASQCVVQDTITVYIISPSVLFVPNTFTPNNDGVNEGYRVFGEEIVTFHIQIFDRWGGLVFESRNIEERWDGKFNGNKVSSGSYVANILAIGSDGKRHKMNQVISVIR